MGETVLRLDNEQSCQTRGDCLKGYRSAVTYISERTLASVFLKIIVSVAIAVGIAERLWLVFHVTINSDAAVTGMMAQRILRGQLFALIDTCPTEASSRT